ncbi:MAG TPA: SdpI family protein [Methanothrix sp.]|nr:SdpI family protein [Methanothrix sp.]
MNTRNAHIIIIALILASFLLGAYLHPHMPERMATHWDAAGQVNGYMNRTWGLFLMPLLSAFIFLAFLLAPRMDPLRKNIDQFRGYLDIFMLLFFSFLSYLYLLTLLWNLGYQFNLISFMAPGLGVIIYYTGVMMENARQNWSIGIRTAWTLSSEAVWDRTNRLAGRLFKAAGALAALGAVFPDLAVYLILVPVVLAAVYPIIYSYREYQKEFKILGRI